MWLGTLRDHVSHSAWLQSGEPSLLSVRRAGATHRALGITPAPPLPELPPPPAQRPVIDDQADADGGGHDRLHHIATFAGGRPVPEPPAGVEQKERDPRPDEDAVGGDQSHATPTRRSRP